MFFCSALTLSFSATLYLLNMRDKLVYFIKLKTKQKATSEIFCTKHYEKFLGSSRS